MHVGHRTIRVKIPPVSLITGRPYCHILAHWILFFLNSWSWNSQHMLMDVLIDRSDLHLSELERVLTTSPVQPVDSFSKILRLLVWTVEVETVEVGAMADSVPPSRHVSHRTVTINVIVIVSVSRGEISAVMICQRISYNFMTTVSRMQMLQKYPTLTV